MTTKLDAAYAAGRATAKQATGQGTSTVADMRAYWADAARGLAATLGWTVAHLEETLRAFHQERLDAEPDLTVYPELRGYRDRLLAEERGMRDGGLDDTYIALSRSFNFWRDTRLLQETGKGLCMLPQPEKCRVLFVPDSDRGPLHLKNVDDPLTYWKPRPTMAQGTPWPQTKPLWIDGVGSGLHIDEIPPEIFPVDARGLCLELCETVAEAREFLVRYNYFWAHCNIVVHDRTGASLAFEKTRCRVGVREPDASGISFITGMGALTPEIADFQRQMRQRYLDQQGTDWDGTDGCFWAECSQKWANMARYVADLALNPTYDNAKQLMEQRDRRGPMCLTGAKSHPDQVVAGCTLVMDLWTPAEKRLHRRQWRGSTPAYLDTPEIVQFV